MPNTVNYAVLYEKFIDEALIASLTTGVLTANANRVKFTGGNEVKIPKLILEGLKDYDRETGYPSTNAQNEWETKKIEMDRGFKFNVDVMDIDETNGVLETSNLISEFVKTKEAPEIDSYRMSKVFKGIGAHGGKIVNTTPAKGTAVGLLVDDISDIQDVVGESEPLLCFISAKAFKFITQSTELNRTLETQEITGQNGITLKVYAIDGVPLIPVPSARMKTAYTFGTGFSAKPYASELNWLIVARSAVVAIEKHRNLKYVKAADSEVYDADQLMGRLYHDLWIFEQKAVGTIANVKIEAVKAATNFVKVDNPKIVVGTAASKDVKITLGEAEGYDGIKWYFWDTGKAATQAGTINQNQQFDLNGAVLLSGAAEQVQQTGTAGHYGALVGVLDGAIVAYSDVASKS